MNTQRLLETMMKKSHKAIIERKPSLSATDTALFQVATMDAFFSEVLPNLVTIDDLKQFQEQYNQVKPCV